MYNSPEGKGAEDQYSDEDLGVASPASQTSGGGEGSPYAISLVGMSKVQDGDEVSPFPSMFEREEAQERGKDIAVRFTTSGGRQYENDFGYGRTVQVLKSWLASEHDIAYASQTLFLGGPSGKIMIDPLSLNDFDEIKPGRSVDIYVAVESESNDEDVKVSSSKK